MILGKTISGGAGRENKNLTIGSSSSHREIKMLDFKVELPIDEKKGVTMLKENRNLYAMILNTFRNTNLLPALLQIKKQIEQEQWAKFKVTAQTLRAQTSQIAAGQLHYDCYFIQDFFAKSDHEAMRQRYNRLIEDSIDFIEYSHQFIADNKQDNGSIDLKQIPISDIQLADGYQLVEQEGTQPHYLCTSPNQSSQERFFERSDEKDKPDIFSSGRGNSSFQQISLPKIGEKELNNTSNPLPKPQPSGGKFLRSLRGFEDIQDIKKLPIHRATEKVEPSLKNMIQSSPAGERNEAFQSCGQSSRQIREQIKENTVQSGNTSRKNISIRSNDHKNSYKGRVFAVPNQIKVGAQKTFTQNDLLTKYDNQKLKQLQKQTSQSLAKPDALHQSVEQKQEIAGTKSEKVSGKRIPQNNQSDGDREEEKQRDSAQVEKRDLGMSVEKMTPSAGGVAAENRSILNPIEMQQQENRDPKQFTQQLIMNNDLLEPGQSQKDNLSMTSKRSGQKIQRKNFSNHGILKPGQGASSSKGGSQLNISQQSRMSNNKQINAVADQHKRPEIEFSNNSIPYTKSAIPADEQKKRKQSPRQYQLTSGRKSQFKNFKKGSNFTTTHKSEIQYSEPTNVSAAACTDLYQTVKAGCYSGDCQNAVQPDKCSIF